jgi:hypothetical protein
MPISFAMSFRPSVVMQQGQNHETNFHENFILGSFNKICFKNRINIKIGK